MPTENQPRRVMGEQPVEKATCEHHWVSRHQPDFPPPIRFVRVCSQCGDIDGDDLARELSTLIEANRWLDAMVTTITAERDTAMALIEQPEADPWCREENCEWRDWGSGP